MGFLSDYFTKPWRNWHKNWLKKRIPPQKSQRLNHRNIFIVPTKAGWGFLVLTLLLWLLGTNYQNNLILVFAFLLLSIMLVCIIHTYSNLSGLVITALHARPNFVGEEGSAQLLIHRNPKRQHDTVMLYWEKGLDTHVSLIEERSHEVSIQLPLKQRGWYRPGRLQVSTRFPLGLMVAWSSLDMDIAVLAYPKPLETDAQQQSAINGEPDDEHSVATMAGGGEEFAGLRDYVPGDSPQHIAWRSLARGQGLASKQFDDYASNSEWLDWHAFSGMYTEERLSRLCDLALQYADSQTPYGLKLPNIHIKPAQGESHRLQVLKALALVGFEGTDLQEGE